MTFTVGIRVNLERAIVYSREKGLKKTFDGRFKTGFTTGYVGGDGGTKATSLGDIVARKDCEAMIEQNDNIRK